MPARASARAPLGGCRRADDDDEVDGVVAAGLEQQGHVDDRNPARLADRAGDEIGAHPGDGGMHETFEPRQRRRVAQHDAPKALAVDPALDHDARKRRLDPLAPSPG